MNTTYQASIRTLWGGVNTVTIHALNWNQARLIAESTYGERLVQLVCV